VHQCLRHSAWASPRVSQLKLCAAHSLRGNSDVRRLAPQFAQEVGFPPVPLAILTAEGDEYLWSESKAFASNAKITLIWILQPVWSSHYWSRSTHTMAHERSLSTLRVCLVLFNSKNWPPKHLAGEGVAFCPSEGNASHSLMHLVPALIELSSHLQMQPTCNAHTYKLQAASVAMRGLMQVALALAGVWSARQLAPLWEHRVCYMLGRLLSC
jgi:hypothetical protein